MAPRRSFILREVGHSPEKDVESDRDIHRQVFADDIPFPAK